MTVSKFDKILPWTGAVAGLLWALWMIISKTPDHPASAGAVNLVAHAAGQNYVAGFALLVAALMLLFFAAQARKSLRSGEAGESTYSSVAHGGLVMAAGGLGLLGIIQIALVNTAKAHDAAATDAIGQLAMIGWLFFLVNIAELPWTEVYIILAFVLLFAAPMFVFFGLVDLTFLAANLLMIAQGGWFPIVVAALVFAVMGTWWRGRGVARRLTSTRYVVRAPE